MRKQSEPVVQNSDGETSQSMSLINESANILFDTMKSIKPLRPSDVNAICHCANGIQNLLRLKLAIHRAKKNEDID